MNWNKFELLFTYGLQYITIANFLLVFSNPLIFLLIFYIIIYDNKNINKNLLKLKLKRSGIALLGFLIIFSLKFIIPRNRPYVLDPKVKLFDNIWCESDNSSFPSGHAYLSVSLLLFLQCYSIGNILIAGLICLSRIYLGAHYLSDVLFSIGFSFLLFFLSNKIFKEIINEPMITENENEIQTETNI